MREYQIERKSHATGATVDTPPDFFGGARDGEAEGGEAASLSIGRNSDNAAFPSSYHVRSKFTLSENVAKACAESPDHCFFLTLTVGEYGDDGWEGVDDPKEVSRRWNNLNRRLWEMLPMKRGIVVPERHKSGAWHLHLFVVLEMSVGAWHENGSWETYLRMRKAHGGRRRALAGALGRMNPQLREAWAMLRKRLHRYGFGRHELIPVQDRERAGNYLGKYLGKGIGAMPADGEKARRVQTRYVGDWMRWDARTALGFRTPTGWSWATKGGQIHRTLVGAVCRALGIAPTEDFPTLLAQAFGSKWCSILWRGWSAAQVYPTESAAAWILGHCTIHWGRPVRAWKCEAGLSEALQLASHCGTPTVEG